MNENATQQPKKKRHGCLIAVGAIIAIIVIVIIAVSVGGGKGSSSAASTTTATKTTSTSKSASKSKNYITKSDFDKIQNGMSYEQVKQIIGCDGDVMSETGTKGDSLYTVVYDWKGKDGVSNATFEFQGDKLETKAQAGLQ